MIETCFLGRGVQTDLDEIWEFIALDDVDAADRWVRKLLDAFETDRATKCKHHKRGWPSTSPFTGPRYPRA